jgi:hypothetical protein
MAAIYPILSDWLPGTTVIVTGRQMTPVSFADFP